jgi:hypothetical protein
VSEGDDPPHQPPASNEYLDAFNKSFQVTFLATTFVFVIFAALGVRIARRLRRDRERNKNIIEADWSPVEDKSGETDLTLR